MSKSTHIQLVCIARRENEAATIESFLRDRGQPVRMQWMQADDSLEENLQKHPADMLYISGDSEKLLEYTLHCCRKVEPHVPILILVNEIQPDSAEMALLKRARDAVSVKHLEHLHAVTLRELVASKLESSLSEAKRELKTLQARVASLVSASGLAIARIQEGILVEASTDFCQLFGQEDETAMVGRPFLEFIQAGEQGRIKKLINRSVQGKQDSEELVTAGQATDGSDFPLSVTLTRVETDEGPAVEIQASRMDQRRSDHREKPAVPTPAVETEPEPQAAVIDDKTMHEIDVALKNGRCRMETRAMLSLDGQDCNIIDSILRLQNEAGKWFEATAESQAASTTLQAADMKLLGLIAELMALRAAKNEPTTVIAPLHPASISQLNTLKAWAESDLKALLKADQQLVLSLAEKAYTPHLEPARKLVEELRDKGLQFAVDEAHGGDAMLQMVETLQPELLCLDRAATQLLISQGNNHAQLSKASAHCHEHGMKIVAFPLQDAHSMAMLWQRGVNLIRGSEFQAPE